MSEGVKFDQQIGIMVDIDTKTELKLLALRRHTSLSTLTRQAIMEWLAGQDQPTRPAPTQSPLFSGGK